MLHSGQMYDYIITGAGAAGLSLAVRMIRSGKFSDKKILLLDQSGKKENDRTWCYWEAGEGFFEEVVYRKWDKLWFYSGDYSALKNAKPYQYKLIRGIDFYQHCLGCIADSPIVELRQGKVHRCVSDASGTYVIFENEKIQAEYIFNSILFGPPQLKPHDFYLIQHFKGWIVETAEPAFRTNEATLMDFRVDQSRGATFVYVMPFSDRKALVEYTLFSEEVLDDDEYDEGLKNYCDEFLKLTDYKIIEEERGKIPMTNYRFPGSFNKIINIGTAGGWTKSSSGYTFSFIQKRTAAIVEALVQKDKPSVKIHSRRFNWYDSTLLHIFHHRQLAGDKIFSKLFESNDLPAIFRFLDNSSSFVEELKVIRHLPKGIFTRAALREWRALF